MGEIQTKSLLVRWLQREKEHPHTALHYKELALFLKPGKRRRMCEGFRGKLRVSVLGDRKDRRQAGAGTEGVSWGLADSKMDAIPQLRGRGSKCHVGE